MPHLTGRLVGPRGEHLRLVKEATGARVVVDVERGPSVRVFGTERQIAAARERLDELLSPAATVVVGEAWGHLIGDGAPYASPAALAARLLGPRGATKHAIARAAGAGIEVARDVSRVYLCGPPACVAAARRALDAHLAPGAALEVSALQAAGAAGSAEEIVRRLVGAGGAALRELEDSTGAGVWVSRDSARVFVSGTPAAIDAARAAITAATVPGGVMVVAALWPELIGPGRLYESAGALTAHLVGREGGALRRIEEATGARVTLEHDSSRVLLWGPPPAIARAREAICAALLPARVLYVVGEWGHLIGPSRPFATPASLCRALIGLGGATRGRIAAATGTLIRVADDNSSVSIMGPPAAVDAARVAMDVLVEPAATLPFADAFAAASGLGMAEGICAWLFSHERANADAVCGPGVAVSASPDGSRLFLYGGDVGAVRGARERLEALFSHARAVDVAERWGRRAVGPGAPFDGLGDLVGVLRRLGGAVEAAAGGGAIVRVSSTHAIIVAGTAEAAARAEAAWDALIVPVATLSVGDAWAHAFRAGGGPFEGPAELQTWTVGALGERGRAVTEATGAVLWYSSGGRLHFFGTPAAAAAARAALEATLLPDAIVSVAAAWAPLVAAGAFQSLGGVVGAIVGPAGATMRAVEGASGARVMVSADNGRLFLGGPPDALARARDEIGRVLAPSAVVSVAAEFAPLVAPGSGVYGSAAELVACVFDAQQARAAAYTAETGVRISVFGPGSIAVSAGVAADGALRPREETGAAVEAAVGAIRARVEPRGVIDLADWRHLIANGDFRSADEMVGAVLGRRYARQRAIEAATGAYVGVLRTSHRVVVAGGPPDAVAAVRAEVDATLTPALRLDVLREFPALAPRFPSREKLAYKLVGDGACNVAHLRERFGAHMRMNGATGEMLFYGGPTDAARAATEARRCLAAVAAMPEGQFVTWRNKALFSQL